MNEENELIYGLNNWSHDQMFVDFYSGTFYAMRSKFKK